MIINCLWQNVWELNTLSTHLPRASAIVSQRSREGRGANVVIEAVGRPESYLSAISEVSYTGRVVYIGYAKEKIPFDTQFFVKKELDIRGSRNAMPNDFKAVVKYMKRGACPVDELITAVYSPEEAQTALENWAANPGEVFRILIKF